MRRLTYKCPRGILVESSFEYDLLNGVCYQDCVDKLGQLEDIASRVPLIDIEAILDANEIVCDLIDDSGNEFIAHISVIRATSTGLVLAPNEYDVNFAYFKNYKNGWALTREELL